MKVLDMYYYPRGGDGPLRLLFERVSLEDIVSSDSPSENGYYWAHEGRLLGVEFESIKDSGDHKVMEIPEFDVSVSVKVTKTGVSIDIGSLSKKAG